MNCTTFSAFLVAAPRSGEGKTTLSLALSRALTDRGLKVQTFKCGPDYIDSSFLAVASKRPCFNLDTWLMGANGVRDVFVRHIQNANVAIIEGVMGLCDGREGTQLAGSSLDCARILGIPVLLAVNARGLAGSLGPLVDGFVRYAANRGVSIVGILATGTGSPSHKNMLSRALNDWGLPPLLGSLPKSESFVLPSRQLGLTPATELKHCESIMTALGQSASKTQLTKILRLCQIKRPQSQQRHAPYSNQMAKPAKGKPPLFLQTKRLALAKDEAFCFYYRENIAWLEAHGWRIIPFSPLFSRGLPAADAVYLGGGYPELHAKNLAANTALRTSIAKACAEALPLYAECGGFVFLTRELIDAQGCSYPMAGVLDASAHMHTGLQSLGYREARLLSPAPFGIPSKNLRGHEFHWSDIVFTATYRPLCELLLPNGEERPSGVVTGPADNILASYIHFYWGTSNSRSYIQAEKDPRYFSYPRNTNQTLSTPGQLWKGGILLLNGPSSSGKSSLANALAQLLDEKGIATIQISLDSFLKTISAGTRHFSSLLQAESAGIPALDAYHSLLKATATPSHIVICDHVLCERPEWRSAFLSAINGIPLFAVHTVCDMTTLKAREENRKDRSPNWTHACKQANAPWQPLPAEWLANTANHTPNELAKRLACTLERSGFISRQAGSKGDAFVPLLPSCPEE